MVKTTEQLLDEFFAAQGDTSRTKIKEEIELARKESRDTGKKKVLTFPRKLIVGTYPEIINDPRFSFKHEGDENFKLSFEPQEKMSIRELVQLCVKSDNKVLAEAKLRSVEHFVRAGDDTRSVVILKEEAQDLRGGRASTTVEVKKPVPVKKKATKKELDTGEASTE